MINTTFADAAENIALGKPYTLSVAPNYALCTDEGDATDLTDGVYPTPREGSALWGHTGCVGWNHIHQPISITVDLGEVQPIGGVAFSSAAGTAGVSFPSSIVIQVSENGQDFVAVGELMRLSEGKSPPPYGVYAEHTFKTTALQTRGRYVRFSAVPSATFLFVDEIEIFRGDGKFLSQPIGGKPMSDTEITDPLRLTQNGVFRRLRSDIDQISDIVGKHVPGSLKTELLAELDSLSGQLNGDVFPTSLAGFRAVVPINDLHRKILAVHGRALAAGKFDGPLVLWHSQPYQLLGLFERPTESLKDLTIRAMIGERRAEVFNIANASAEERTVQFQMEGLPPDAMTVYQVDYVDTREGAPVASALVKLTGESGTYQTTVPAGMTRQIWLSVTPGSGHAGVHSSRVILQSDSWKKAIDLKLSVANFQMPQPMTCAFGLWDYVTNTAYGITEQNQAAARDDMAAHGVNSVWCTSGSTPMPAPDALDSEGNLTGKIDYSSWDQFVNFWKQTGVVTNYFAFAAIHTNGAFAGLAQGTPAFDRAVEQWAADWVRHNTEILGIEPGRAHILLLDEPGASEHFLTTYNFAKPFRKGAAGGIRIFVDPVGTSVDTVEHADKALQLADIVSPTLDHYLNGTAEQRAFYQQLRAGGKELWYYMCSGPSRHFDPSYYRLQPWHALAAGANGSQFWAYGDNGMCDNWNEYAAIGRTSFAPGYVGPDSITTSKHWEAAREGVQDFEYVVILREKVKQLEAAGNRSAAAQAQRVLDNLSEEKLQAAVTSHNTQNANTWNNASAIGEEMRLKVLDLLESLPQ